jgi:ABC-2 type transport system permease protein
MSTRRALLVARWEFLRFAKTKDLVIGVLVMMVIYGGAQLVGDFARGRAAEERSVAVLSAPAFALEAPLQLGNFNLVPETRGQAVADSLVLAGDLDAVIVPHEDGWQLRVEHDRSWQDLLRAQVGALARQQELQRLNLDPDVLAALNTPHDIATVLVGAHADSAGERPGVLVVVIVVGVMLLGLFTGLGYVFVAITAEKTQRTTESLLSVLSPQEWIDGKILGLTGVVLVTLLSYLVAWFLWQIVDWRFLGGSLSLPTGMGGMDLALSLLFAAGGFAFWFTLFALVAATINDPNTSNRGAMMFLPFIPLSLVFAGLDSPDAGWMRALSLIPGVSPSAMPLRILRGDPAAGDVLVSLVLLVGSAAALRWAAGRVFGVSMLMTGKEPGVREVWRWLREPVSGQSAPY